MLAAFLSLVFLTGGGSRIDIQSLVLLRPVSVFVCAMALLTLQREHVARHKWIFAGLCVSMILAVAHMIPLPPGWWQGLNGRGELIEVDRLVGLEGVWRPLTLTPMNGWHALLSLFAPIAVVLLGVQLSRDELYRMLLLVLALGALSGLLGVLQLLGSPQGVLYFYRITNNGAAVGLFANRNHAAVMLACLFPMLVVFAATHNGTDDQRKRRALMAGAIAIVLVPLILVTGSRSGFVIAAAGLIGAALLYRRPEGELRPKRGKRGLDIPAVPFFAGIALLCMVFVTLFFARAEAIERLFEESAGDSNRSLFWNSSLVLFWKYFPWGAGSGSFVEAFQIVEPRHLLASTYLNRAHNDLIEVAVTWGVPGLLALAAGVGLFLWRAFRLWSTTDGKRRSVAYARMASIVIAMLLLASLFDYPLRTPTMMCLFALLALWLAAERRSNDVTLPATATSANPKPGKKRARKPNRLLAATRDIGVARIAISAVFAVAGGFLAFALAASGVTRTKNPQVALAFVPNESTALAARADQLLLTNPTQPPAAARALALAALRNQAVNPKALRIMGFYAESTGDPATAASLIAGAAKLSRREIGAQLWLIEEGARRNDTPTTLAHYDIALRTKPETQAILFPRLSAAIADREVRHALTPYIRANAGGWPESFLNFATMNAENLPALVALHEESGGLADPEAARLHTTSLLQQLLNNGKFETARLLYSRLPNASPDKLTSPALKVSNRKGTGEPVDWQFIYDPDAGAAIEGGSSQQGSRLVVFASPSTTRSVGSKLLYLKPGSYSLEIRLAEIERGDGGYLRWQLRCPLESRSQAVWSFDTTTRSARGIMPVPQNCPVQFLDLVVSGGKGQAGLEAVVSSISLTRLNR